MEANLLARKAKLKSKIPDIQKSLDMITVLEAKKKAEERIETQFLLSDLLYSRAIIEPTDRVCLWLGVNATYTNFFFSHTFSITFCLLL
jgi:hypothetical protein